MNLKKLITIILCAIILNFALVNSDNDDELEDFDFISSSDVKHYNDYEETTEKNNNLADIFDSKEDVAAEQFHNPFNLKEKVIRTALAKALTNKVLRQKFVEVIPILRVLSSQQRLALSALISAQISAKPGTELKLDQVKSMFGDSRKLIIPLVFDIANLVKTAAKNSLNYLDNYQSQKPDQMHISSSRRNFEVGQSEEEDEEVLFVSKENIDPLMINDQLYRLRSSRKLEHVNKSEGDPKHSRTRRSTMCLHGCPLRNKTQNSTFRTPNRQEAPTFPVIENRSFQIGKLNTTNFISPYDKSSPPSGEKAIYKTVNEADITKTSYEELENLAFFDMNATSYNSHDVNDTRDNIPEELPVPQSLVGSPQRASNKVGGGRKPQARGPRPKGPPTKKCEKFTASMCLKADDYPTELILGSIRRHKHAMSALLAEYRDKAAEQELEEYQEEFELSQQRREDGEHDVMPGGMCQSVVRFARPQKARSASGEWKYIVNTGQHTQTLRLEKCSHPQASCSYLSENYRSRCIQVYNYHRLLSWDKSRGLHVEIFKVPICCACHVDGYRETYPPSSGSYHGKINEYSVIKTVRPHPYTSFEEEEYEEEDEGDDSIAYQYGNGFKKVRPNKYDPSELLSSSATVKNQFEGTKKHKISPIFGSHVNPPAGAFDQQYNFKRGPNLSPSVGGHLNNLNRFRRPQQGGYESDDRADQESAGSDLGKEVTVFPTNDKTTIRPKRKRVSSLSTATSKPAPISSFSPTAIHSSNGAKNFHSPKISNTKSDMNKRINYNYHPIIDFFEEHQPSVAAAKKQKRIGPNSTKDRRIGLGEPEDSWRPIIME